MSTYRRFRSSAMTVCLWGLGAVAAAGTPQPLETIYGYWEEEDSDQCLYSLEFRRDGALLVVSKDERLRGTFRLEAPEPTGEHDGVVHRRITADNGGTDCEGDSSNQKGSSASAFMHYDGPNTLYLCRDAKGQACFGRFLRKR